MTDLFQPLVDRVDDALKGVAGAVVLRWGTVTQAVPLRIKLDADADALPFKPAAAPSGLQVGDRVRCSVQNLRVTIEAVAGRGPATQAQVNAGVDTKLFLTPKTARDAVDKILHSSSMGQVLAGTAWTDLITATVTTRGGEICAEAFMFAHNAASGLDRQIAYRIICDGAAFSPVLLGVQPIPLNFAGAANPRMPSVMWGDGLLPAGAHTFKLQVSASAGSAIYVEASRLKLTEKGRFA